MANGHENLIPVSERSLEEARELGKKGGIASGKARKEKKELKERLSAAMEIISKKIAEQDQDEDKKKIIKEMGYDVWTLIKVLNDPKSSNKDRLKAAEMYWDRIEGKPMQKQTINIEGRSLDKIDKAIEDIKNTKDESETSKNPEAS